MAWWSDEAVVVMSQGVDAGGTRGLDTISAGLYQSVLSGVGCSLGPICGVDLVKDITDVGRHRSSTDG